MEQTCCAFTGHRPNRFPFGYEESHPDCLRVKSAIGQSIDRLIQRGVRTFYTGMAQGVDLWAARQVLARRDQLGDLCLVAVQPCADQAKGWPDDLAREYEQILALCDERVCLRPHYTPYCMMERNRWMVDRSGLLLAVYDGSKTGGTASTVKYAASRRREIWLLDPDSLLLARMEPPEEYEQLTLE